MSSPPTSSAVPGGGMMDPMYLQHLMRNLPIQPQPMAPLAYGAAGPIVQPHATQPMFGVYQPRPRPAVAVPVMNMGHSARAVAHPIAHPVAHHATPAVAQAAYFTPGFSPSPAMGTAVHATEVYAPVAQTATPMAAVTVQRAVPAAAPAAPAAAAASPASSRRSSIDSSSSGSSSSSFSSSDSYRHTNPPVAVHVPVAAPPPPPVAAKPVKRARSKKASEPEESAAVAKPKAAPRSRKKAGAKDVDDDASAAGATKPPPKKRRKKDAAPVPPPTTVRTPQRKPVPAPQAPIPYINGSDEDDDDDDDDGAAAATGGSVWGAAAASPHRAVTHSHQPASLAGVPSSRAVHAAPTAAVVATRVPAPVSKKPRARAAPAPVEEEAPVAPSSGRRKKRAGSTKRNSRGGAPPPSDDEQDAKDAYTSHPLWASRPTTAYALYSKTERVRLKKELSEREARDAAAGHTVRRDAPKKDPNAVPADRRRIFETARSLDDLAPEDLQALHAVGHQNQFISARWHALNATERAPFEAHHATAVSKWRESVDAALRQGDPVAPQVLHAWKRKQKGFDEATGEIVHARPRGEGATAGAAPGRRGGKKRQLAAAAAAAAADAAAAHSTVYVRASDPLVAGREYVSVLKGPTSATYIGGEIPQPRIRKLVDLSTDRSHMNKDAAGLIHAATEEFIGWIAQQTLDVAEFHGRKQVEMHDLMECFSTQHRLAFARVMWDSVDVGAKRKKKYTARGGGGASAAAGGDTVAASASHDSAPMHSHNSSAAPSVGLLPTHHAQNTWGSAYSDAESPAPPHLHAHAAHAHAPSMHAYAAPPAGPVSASESSSSDDDEEEDDEGDVDVHAHSTPYAQADSHAHESHHQPEEFDDDDEGDVDGSDMDD